MIYDELIDLTENSVFGISEHHSNENRVIPWIRDDPTSQESSMITLRTDSYTSLSYTISQTTSNGFRNNILTYSINDLDFTYTLWNNSVDNIYQFDEFDDFGISTWFTGDSYISSTSTSSSTKYYMLSGGNNLRLDVFGKPIEMKKSHGRSVKICPLCGKVNNYVWTGVFDSCDCQKHKNKDRICWRRREKEIEHQKNSQEERHIPWMTEEEIQASKKRSGKHRFRRFFGDDPADRREDLLDRICWLNREKSYFGIGGKVDWVGIEERWEERDEEIAQILSGNTVEIQDVTI